MINFILGILVMYILSGIAISFIDSSENEKIYTVFMWIYCWWMLLFLIICTVIKAITYRIVKSIRKRGERCRKYSRR